MKTKYSFIAGIICVLIMAGIFICTYVFDRLEDYKNEITRVLNVQNIRQSRHEENFHILFERLNHIEANQQDMTETVDRLDWLSRHIY